MRKLRNKDKQIKRKRMILAIFWGIALVLLGSIIYRFNIALKESIWDGENRINLVFKANPILIASLNPVGSSLEVLVIPNKTFIEVVRGYGSYRVESVYSLGELEGQGGRLLSDSIQEYMGVPIDAYASINNLTLEAQEPDKVKKFLTGGLMKLLKGEGETNLTRWDLFLLWWGINKIGINKVSAISLGETTASSEIILPDSTRATKIDPDRLDGIVNRLFADEGIRLENLAIAVLNGTAHEGLAHHGARIISNIGGRVVGISDIVGAGPCQVRCLGEYKKSYTVNKLQRIFNCQWGGNELLGQRAQVVLILNENYWRRLVLPNVR